MSRRITPAADAEAQVWLDRLLAAKTPADYREAMRKLGWKLGQRVLESLTPAQSVLLITTNEDADFLAQGVLEALVVDGTHPMALACFWNDRATIGDAEFAPIVRSYVEPLPQTDVFLVVKSIVATACVVRTLIVDLIAQHQPQRIVVASPVMLNSAPARLRAELGEAIAARLSFICFAEDDEVTDRYTPELVRQRRALVSATILPDWH